MQREEIQLQRNEFTLFVLLYVAGFDCQISTDEMDFISGHGDKEVIKKVKKWFDQCNDSDCLEVINQHKTKYCSTREEKDKLMDEIKSLIDIGDDYSRMERTCMMLLEKLLSPDS